MTRRRTNPKFDEHLSGVRATFERECARCPEPILVGQSVVKHRDGWIHVTCASGFGDE